MLKSVSASQVDNFDRCARFWYFKSIDKIRTPQSTAQMMGSAIHTAIEDWLLKDVIDPQWAKYIDAARRHIPEGPRLIEHPFEMPTYDGGPVWTGRIDLIVEARSGVKVLDYKSTANFKWSKTSEQLLTNTQLNSYALFVMTKGAPEVEIGHINLLKGTVPQSKYVSAVATSVTVRPVWQASLQTVANMVECSTAKSAHELPYPKTYDPCNMYGGCEHKARCGRPPELFAAFSRTPGAQMSNAPVGSSFMDQLTAAHANGNGSTPVPPQGTQVFPPPTPAPVSGGFIAGLVAPAPGLPPVGQGLPPIMGQDARDRAAQMGVELPTPGAGFAATAADYPNGLPGILAPDATPRAEIVLPPVEAAGAEAPKKTRGRPKKAPEAAQAPLEGQPPLVDVFGAAQALPTPSFTANITPNRVNVPELMLYVDCMPTKGSGPVTRFEDFIAPIAQEVADMAGVSDYRLVPYGGGKALLADGIRRHLQEVPPILVIHSMANGAREALDVLSPYARQVIEGLRG